MKKLLLILVLIASIGYTKESEKLGFYAQYKDSKINLKWIAKDYSSKNIYRLYRSENGKKAKLIATIKPTTYELLKSQNHSDDYIFMIYPFKNVKNIDEQIRASKAEKRAGGFRVLKLLEDNIFAKDLGQFFVDSNVKKAHKYKYRLELHNKNKKVQIKEASIDTTEKQIQSGVFWVKAKPYEWGVGLTWSTANKSGFYNVYRKFQSEKKYKKLNSSPLYISSYFANRSEAFYSDKGLNKNQEPSYYVTKVDYFGSEGTPSYEVSAKMLLNLKPKIVQNIFVKNSDRVITLRWRKVAKSLGYNIYRSKNYKGGYEKINKEPLKKEIYNDTNFNSNQNYYYYITALNLHGESKPSLKMLAYARDVTPPPAPTKLKASVKAGKVELKWTGVKSKDLLGYRIYMSMQKDAKDWSMVTKEAIVDANITLQREKTLSRFPYYYKVVAVDKSFNESDFSNIVKTRLPDVVPPRQPTIIKLITYPNRIYLKWDSVSAYDLDYYNVYKKDGKKVSKANQKPIRVNTYEDFNITKGKRVDYFVTAVDKSSNESNNSKQLSTNTLDTVAPTIENFKLTKGKKSVTISFTCSDKDYSGYEVYKSNGSDLKYYNISGFKTDKTFTDKVVMKKTNYFYMLKVYDITGNIKESKVLSVKLK